MVVIFPEERKSPPVRVIPALDSIPPIALTKIPPSEVEVPVPEIYSEAGATAPATVQPPEELEKVEVAAAVTESFPEDSI